MIGDRNERLAAFVEYVGKYLKGDEKGDEKGEGQLFLEHLFQAFNQKGVREAGATLEMRIKKEDARGTAFADLVWKPIVLIEVKKCSEYLSSSYHDLSAVPRNDRCETSTTPLCDALVKE